MTDTTTTSSNPALRSAIQLAMSKAPRCDAASLAPIRGFPMLEVVKEMEPELTSKEPKTSPLALQVLAFAAIERSDDDANCASLLCTTQSLEVLFAFLVTKINHFTTIDSAVDATARVFVWYAANHPQLLITTSGTAGNTPILTSVINNMLCKISVPSMFGNSKASAFALLKALLSPKIVDGFSKEQTNKFLEAFLVSVDGERDPAYVLEVFTMAYTILTSFSASVLDNYSEDYFMTLSNYFPVLFNPPPKCTVTKEELKEALTKVLMLPVFHEVCIPFVLSKLSSPAEVAKVDSLALLRDIMGRVVNKKKTATSASSADDIPSYEPSLLEPHLADVLGSLRGEALKLASSVAYNPSAKDLLRLVMGTAEDVGAVLNALGKKEAVLSLCDRTLTACVGTVEAGSDARAYAMLLNALAKGGDVVASALASYILPLLGVRLMGIDTLSTSAAGAVTDHEERIYMSAVAVIGGIFSAIETHKNGTTTAATTSGTSTTLSILVKPQTTQCIVNALFDCVSCVGSKHPSIEDALPLVVEVISTYIAIRDVLPGSELCPTSEEIVETMLRRACAAHTDNDGANVTLRAISNVARVATDLVVEATLSEAKASTLLFELAATARLPTFFVALHHAVGDKQNVRTAALNALLLGGTAASGKKSITAIATAIDVFGYRNPAIDAYLHALALFTATEAAAAAATINNTDADSDEASSGTASSPVIKSVIAELLALSIPEQCSTGADLLCDLLSRCPTSQVQLLANKDPIGSMVLVSWLCAVASASKEAVATYYDAATWVQTCLQQMVGGNATNATTADKSEQLKALALRAISSIANKGAEGVVGAETFEAAMEAMETTPLTLGAKAAVRAAVCKGLLARGADALTTLAPLMAAVEAYGTDAVNIGSTASNSAAAATTVVDNNASLLANAFGQLISPPFPSSQGASPTVGSSASLGSSTSSSSPMWIQRAYCTITDALLLAATPTPLALVCLATLISKAPQRVVAATATELVQKLAKVLDVSNVLVAGGGNKKVAGTTATTSAISATIATPSTAAMLCIVRLLDRADGMPIEAVRAAAAAMLTYTEAAKALYYTTYATSGSKNSASPAIPMALRELFVSALLAVSVVVLNGPTTSGANNAAMGKVTAKADPLKPLAKEAGAKWVLGWMKVALDDPKRPIRTMAAKASHEWHKVK